MNVQLTRLLDAIRPRVRDVVGIDVGAAGTKVVRLRADRSGHITVLAAALLPRIAPPTQPGDAVEPLSLPKNLQAWSAALAYSFPQAAMKLLSLPAEKVAGAAYADLLGVARSPEIRVGHLAFEGESRSEVPVLAVGVTADEVAWLQSLIPPGKPALGAVEISGLAALTAYQAAIDVDTPRCDLVIDAGEQTTTMSLCFKGKPMLIRPFMQGAGTVVAQVMQDLGVDAETAHDILNVGSIDVRASVHRVYETFLRQLSIAVDFAERRSGKRLEKIYLSGGLAVNHDFVEELHDHVGLQPETWNPWANMIILPNAVPPGEKGHECRFAAATGAALSLLEVS